MMFKFDVMCVLLAVYLAFYRSKTSVNSDVEDYIACGEIMSLLCDRKWDILNIKISTDCLKINKYIGCNV